MRTPPGKRRRGRRRSGEAGRPENCLQNSGFEANQPLSLTYDAMGPENRTNRRHPSISAARHGLLPCLDCKISNVHQPKDDILMVLMPPVKLGPRRQLPAACGGVRHLGGFCGEIFAFQMATTSSNHRPTSLYFAETAGFGAASLGAGGISGRRRNRGAKRDWRPDLCGFRHVLTPR